MLKRQSSSVQVNEPCPSSVAATYRYDLSDWRFIPKSADCGERVFGKMGRAETATDPAGLEMFETTIRFEHPSQWPSGMTQDQLIDQMNAALLIHRRSPAEATP